MHKKPNISLFFHVYNDEKTIERVFNKSLEVLREHANKYEIIIINDGSPDNCGAIADQLCTKYLNSDPRRSGFKVIHHPKNMGYGAAIRSGLSVVKYEWVCFTDGDDEYDVYDLIKLLKLRQYYQLIITFRYLRVYSGKRIIISQIYNWILRLLFKTNFRDISTGLRLIHRDVIDDIQLISDSPFIGAEIAIKTRLKGYPVGEVGIQTFKREFGKGASVTLKNILATIKDMFKVYRMVFSLGYDLPENRDRK